MMFSYFKMASFHICAEARWSGYIVAAQKPASEQDQNLHLSCRNSTPEKIYNLTVYFERCMMHFTHRQLESSDTPTPSAQRCRLMYDTSPIRRVMYKTLWLIIQRITFGCSPSKRDLKLLDPWNRL
jgi:hypothetical protein